MESGEPTLEDVRTGADHESRDRNWFITINNPTDECRKACSEVEKVASYVIMAKEVGKEKGVLHYHLVVVFPQVQRFSAVKKLFPRGDIGVVRSMAHAVRYCEKDGDYVEFGKRPRMKNIRWSPLDAVAKRVCAGADRRQIAREFPVEFIRYYRGIDELIQCQKPQESLDVRYFGPYHHTVEVDWNYTQVFVGPAGLGKSQFAKSFFGPGRVLVVSQVDDLRKFNAEDHDGIIFDDFDFGSMKREDKIHLVDQDEGRSIKCRFQNAFIPPNTRKIITCNAWMPDGAAVDRRVRVHNLWPYPRSRMIYWYTASVSE